MGTFSNNSVKKGNGGALYMEESNNQMIISNSTFTNNKAYLKGGAIYSQISNLL